MATPETVVSVQEIIEAMPDLRLKLEKKAKSLEDQKPGQSGFIQKAKEHVEGLFQSTESDINLEELATVDDYEEQLDGIFDRMIGKMQKKKEDLIEECKKLKQDEIKPVLTFWATVGEFLHDVLDWLGNMFNYVLGKIRKGYKIVKDAVSGIFRTIYDFLKKVF